MIKRVCNLKADGLEVGARNAIPLEYIVLNIFTHTTRKVNTNARRPCKEYQAAQCHHG
jgi:hypothetical protein